MAQTTARAGGRQVVQGRHVGDINALAFAPGGLLASASEDGSIRIWDVPNRDLVRVIRSTTVGKPRNVAWTGTGDQLFASGEQITTVTFDLHGQEIAKKGHGFDIWLRARGSVSLVKGTEDYSKNLFWIEDGASPRIDLRHNGMLPSEITRSADGRTIVAPLGKGVAMWRPQPGSVADEQVLPAGGRVLSAAADAKGEHIVAAVEKTTGSTTIEMLSTAPGSGQRTLVGARSFAHTVVASADGSRAAAVSYDGVWVYDLASGNVVWSHASAGGKIGHIGLSMNARYARAAAFSPDGRFLVIAEQDGTLVAFDAVTGRLHGELGSSVRAPRAFTFASGGDRLVAATDDRITVWSTKTGNVEDHRSVQDVVSIAVLPPGDLTLVEHPDFTGTCAIGSEAWITERWSGLTPPPSVDDDAAPTMTTTNPTKSGALWPPSPGRTDQPLCIKGKTLAVSFPLGLAIVAFEPGPKPDKQSAFVVDLKTKQRVELESFHELYSIAPTFSPDGRWALATTGSGFGLNNALAVWDTRTGKMVRRSAIAVTLTSPTASMNIEGVHRFAMDADAKRIALVYGKRVSLRDLATDKETAAFDAAVTVTAVAYAAGDTLFVGLEDGTFSAYDGGKLRASGVSPGGPVRAIAVDGGSGSVATLSDDGGIRFWDSAKLQLKATSVDFDDDEWLSFTPAGAYAGTEEVSDRIAWAFDDPPEEFRFEQFARTYASAALVATRLAGKQDDAPAITTRPPRVSVTGPPEIVGAIAKLRVHASSGSRVDAVRVYVEGRPVTAQSVCSKEGDVDLQVPLAAGLNRVTITAFDDRGAASNPAVVDVTSRSAARPDVWVVAAGVSHYPRLPEKYQLQLANADARSVAAAFTAQAGTGQTYANAHVTVLVDEQVTVDSLTRALDGLREMKPEDIAIVVLAGHGVKPSANEDMVFLTSSSELSTASVRASGVGWKAIGARLAAAKGRVLVLLDACHSGHVTQDVVVPNNDLASSLVKEQRAGVLVFAAAKGRQLSYEPSGARGLQLTNDTKPLVQTGEAHGLFTGALLKALATKDTDRDGDGVIEASELVDEVSARVGVASNGLQTPWVARRELFGDFHVVELPK